MRDLPIQEDLTRRYGWPVIYCEDADFDVALAFTLEDEVETSIQINVPFHELVVPMKNRTSTRTEPILEGDKPLCDVALSSTKDPEDCSLGDPFLRSAYTFYYLAGHFISIAQASNNPTGENVVPVSRGFIPELNGTG